VCSNPDLTPLLRHTAMKLPYRVLVLDDDENALSGLAELLRGEGHQVTPCSTYADAQLVLSAGSYDLFVTDVRLRSFNGLHLVAKVRAEQPDMGIVIMTAYEDMMMELEARRYNAHFVRKPIKPAEFLQAVASSLGNVRRQRRWPRKQVTGGFRVTVGGAPAAVMDVGYGGLRLQMANIANLPARFAIEVSGIGLNLEVQPVWSYPTDDGSVVCGAALAAENTPAARTWRTIVDRLSA
jgi:DNA-binding NtrC family response regulator